MVELASGLNPQLPGSIPGHAYVYDSFNSFLQDSLGLEARATIVYASDIGLHRGL